MIMRISICVGLLLFFGSCISSGEKLEPKKTTFEYDLYHPSEMSLLMNHMLLVNDSIKKQIIAGEIPKDFPREFLAIDTAVMTDTKFRTDIFEAYSKVLIDNQKDLFDTNVEVPLVDKYNNTINTCLACHKTECVGPIPKIEKLLIR